MEIWLPGLMSILKRRRGSLQNSRHAIIINNEPCNQLKKMYLVFVGCKLVGLPVPGINWEIDLKVSIIKIYPSNAKVIERSKWFYYEQFYMWKPFQLLWTTLFQKWNYNDFIVTNFKNARHLHHLCQTPFIFHSLAVYSIISIVDHLSGNIIQTHYWIC